MLANFGLKIRPFKESNLKNFSQIKRPMAGTIYYRPVGKGAATDGLANPHRFRRSVEQKTPSDFSVNPSIPLFENCLKKKLNVPLVKIFLLQTFIRNRVSSFKNLEGKSKSQRLLGIGKRTPRREWPISVLPLLQLHVTREICMYYLTDIDLEEVVDLLNKKHPTYWHTTERS